jgi:predicted methyltransferase
MYHYVGAPYSRRGQKDIHRGIAERLDAAGFIAEFDTDLMGFICHKRR